MHDSTLLKVSIISSIIGMILLILIDRNTVIKQSAISELNEDTLDKYVKIKARITSIHQTQKIFALELEDETGKIKAVLFKNNKNTDNYNLQKDRTVEIEGKFTEYKNQPEIIIDKIRIL